MNLVQPKEPLFETDFLTKNQQVHLPILKEKNIELFIKRSLQVDTRLIVQTQDYK